MTPSPKYSLVRNTIARSLLQTSSRNELLLCSDFIDTFNSRIKLGGGIQLSREILAKCFASRGGDGKYCMACEDLGIEYKGECVFVVMTSIQMYRNAPRCTAFGIYDSVEGGMLADKQDVIAKESIGRMQFSLTNALKASLSKFLFNEFPTKRVSDR
jgi:hypothetical protein